MVEAPALDCIGHPPSPPADMQGLSGSKCRLSPSQQALTMTDNTGPQLRFQCPHQDAQNRVCCILYHIYTRPTTDSLDFVLPYHLKC